jgi:hypothetical protein
VEGINYSQPTEDLPRKNDIAYPLAIAILGAVISTGTVLFVIFIEPGYFSSQWMDRDGNVLMHIFGLRTFDLINNAVWPLLCFLIGLTLCTYGIIQAVNSGRQNKISQGNIGSPVFALTSISLGILFIMAMIWYLVWLEPEWDSVLTRQLMPGGQELTLYRDPGWIKALLVWKAASFALGAAVTGLGLAQFRKAKHK